ncbi:MAG: hypothetical protein ABIR57_15330 [Aeromicrobium sp.]
MDMQEHDLHDLRLEVSMNAAAWLAHYGDHLWQLGSQINDDEMIGVGIVSQMVGQVAEEAINAYVSERWYAGACLTRQMVEAQYLLAYFASDISQASRWLRASPGRLTKSFRPAKLREAGGFSGSDYKIHCDWGGHPSPGGRWLLPNHKQHVSYESLWIDLGQHATEAAFYVWEATRNLPPLNELLKIVPEDLRNDVTTLMGAPPDVLTDWYALDPLAARISKDEFDPEWISAQLGIEPSESEL